MSKVSGYSTSGQSEPGTIRASLVSHERPLWVVSGHPETRKLSDRRIRTRDALVNVRFRPEADTRQRKKNRAGWAAKWPLKVQPRMDASVWPVLKRLPARRIPGTLHRTSDAEFPTIAADQSVPGD